MDTRHNSAEQSRAERAAEHIDAIIARVREAIKIKYILV
jgi:hypothetical protein